MVGTQHQTETRIMEAQANNLENLDLLAFSPLFSYCGLLYGQYSILKHVFSRVAEWCLQKPTGKPSALIMQPPGSSSTSVHNPHLYYICIMTRGGIYDEI